MNYRLPVLLSGSGHLLDRDDLPDSSGVWEEEPAHLHLDLLDRRLRFGHVRQGIWHCRQTDPGREQPVHACLDVCLCHRHWVLHPDPDELL